ncbi:Protein kinase-like domain protein [Niveomyces insectorum RCEF 264]|uniref:non-specific serine/threonine protein kinase n=1 Tax=Niveomyces insectorum RCEF 264 TaxID=1081102 RepID=A0A167MFJ3_9HYPO|nr:Protein kinase-like domain protein [Niveomyces insectorum RCEF 264]
MADQTRSEIIKSHPIQRGLDAFRASFSLICEDKSISRTPDTLSILCNEGTGVEAGLKLEIWDQVDNAVTESTPPPRPKASSLEQTPWLRNTSSFVNSSEHRKYVDGVLKEELGPMYVGLRDFDQTYFGGVADLETASEAFFEQCTRGNDPLFDQGWTGWPIDANQDGVLNWFAGFSERLSTFAEAFKSSPVRQRRPLARPNEPIDGSIAKRKMDIGFVNDVKARKDSRYHWSQILVPGELKSNPSADKASDAWLDLGRYAREVLAAQYTRRFVLGFTICGPLMRIWAFDRLGGIASEQFDINKDGPRFVFAILGFLWMTEEQLGFDPTIVTLGDEQYIDIKRGYETERLVIDKRIKRAPCIAGRATTCWKAHRQGDPQTILVIKDSWQYTERDEEGELLREAADGGVINVARYYHHETVQVGGIDDDIRVNIRRELDITTAENYRAGRSAMSGSINTATTSPRKGRSTAGMKRSSSQTGAPLPPSKRPCSTPPTKVLSSPLPNRVHRRVVLCDFGEPIYKASSQAALLRGLKGCIEGHESLHKAGFLHRDISINNLMINEDTNNPSLASFLIDLDLAVRERRDGASGARGKTGTRAFMAIGALLGEQHSFMHDLESFFWVLFWICVHYQGPDQGRVVPRFDKWNSVDMEELARLKKGEIDHEGDFLRTAEANFTTYFRPMIPWVNRLRKAVFPNGGRWEREDQGLYSRMMDILREAAKDQNVSMHRE